jgi:hypothetical protein
MSWRAAKHRHHKKRVQSDIVGCSPGEVEVVRIRRKIQPDILVGKRRQYLRIRIGRDIANPQCSLAVVVLDLGEELAVTR